MSPRLRRVVIAGSALVVGSGVLVVAATQANAATGCSVNYQIVNQWPGGFQGNIGITNLGDPITSWTLKFTFGAGQTITQLWNGTASQSGSSVTVTSLSYNGAIGTNQTLSSPPGFTGTWNNSSNPVPTNFTLNGVACNGSTGGSPTGGPSSAPPSSRPPSSAPPSSQPPSSAPPSSRPPSSPPVSVSPGTHLDNPFVGAKGYVNSDWAAEVSSISGGSRIANQTTGVWIDSINAITAPAGSGYTTSVRGHLDRALSQGANLIEFVIYDLPGRDCAALASNGELGPTEIGRYETDYIDPIAAIFSDPKYAGIRIVAIIEPDSLPNLVTNASGQNTATAECTTMLQNGNYVTGVEYALSKLHAIPNVYNYVDAAHSGWLGWSSNFDPAIQLFAQVAQGSTGGFATVDGFITDTANYTPTQEPFLTNPNLSVGGQPVNSSNFYQFNPFLDELSYAQAFYQKATAAGFSRNIGMLIDTSRNGWGGPARPTAVSTSTDLNTYVDQSRIDRRPSRGDWCNQSGAGLGARPTASPATDIDAYVWIKPPGESDGSSSLIPTGPDNPAGKGFDQMCDPTYGGNTRNNNSPTNALPNAPVSGAFFPAQLQQLMANAFPPLS